MTRFGTLRRISGMELYPGEEGNLKIFVGSGQRMVRKAFPIFLGLI